MFKVVRMHLNMHDSCISSMAPPTGPVVSGSPSDSSVRSLIASLARAAGFREVALGMRLAMTLGQFERHAEGRGLRHDDLPGADLETGLASNFLRRSETADGLRWRARPSARTNLPRPPQERIIQGAGALQL